VPPDWRALFGLVEKVNLTAAQVSEADIGAARDAGWTEEAIYDAITTCGLFKFYNTWVDGAGVPDLPAEAYRASGRRMAGGSYA
jgi:alkylhydroperoxidase family enzyme